MKIEQAKKLTVGAVVRCPADRGADAYSGRVSHIGSTTHKNIHGVEYVWVTVRDQSGNGHVWPSHRLR